MSTKTSVTHTCDLCNHSETKGQYNMEGWFCVTIDSHLYKDPFQIKDYDLYKRRGIYCPECFANKGHITLTEHCLRSK
jgi:hypothetical protein